MARFAALIWTHGPTAILVIGSDRDQSSVGWELTFSTSFHDSWLPGFQRCPSLCYRTTQLSAVMMPALKRIEMRIAMLGVNGRELKNESRADCAEYRILHSSGGDLLAARVCRDRVGKRLEFVPGSSDLASICLYERIPFLFALSLVFLALVYTIQYGRKRKLRIVGKAVSE